jgi:glycosyltransferase involved in cell wall biosynthesis
MPNKSILSDVTVVMPCYNEGVSLLYTIKYLKSVGFKNILIVDDNSIDDTYSIVEKEKVLILKNIRNMGFTFSLLKGLYGIKTKYALVSSPDIIFEKDSLIDFIHFGIKGNYSLLFSKKKKRSIFSIDIAPLLRERYGINISEPLLDVVFVNQSLLDKIKTETISDDFILLELVRIVMKNNLKLGTYYLKIEYLRGKSLISPFLNRYFHQLRGRRYLRKAFPKKYKESIIKKVLTGVSIAVLGYLALRLIEFVIGYFIISHLIIIKTTRSCHFKL